MKPRDGCDPSLQKLAVSLRNEHEKSPTELSFKILLSPQSAFAFRFHILTLRTVAQKRFPS
ncbi:MAG: hypothetical protein A2499_15780 [Stygiobacter sp. RIFOXYC12_FULL_38_8]|nr:MAG: hypothetical protein A2279_00870 [Stygiobacter sp. RIFOXYA12_FULL_38_9]OGV06278.1 MAG: hypothetical protein A2299_12665 [Stygiobacter sp. RIFOXYB2_FULL_37_11]OGV17955.1 MAG: hypothetical protein A2237_07975 [Stygiobacter sp. RIFOXYA2_FULL_38_8]OGV23776.1 MAG: hypothetical protein A2499_15780 [Stygiobacter sp. RIFOXYC12_FULL_38_8]